MNCFLLYRDKEWAQAEAYYDTDSIIQDLGLRTLFLMAAKAVVMEKGRVKRIEKEDPFLMDAMRKVMMVPLTAGEDIRFRQMVMEDCLTREGFTCALYDITAEMMIQWDKLGRKTRDKSGSRNPAVALLNDIRLLELFVETLGRIKKLFAEYIDRLSSEGLRSFYERLCLEFSDEQEERIVRMLEDISFYADAVDEENVKNNNRVKKPRIVLECGIGEGLKFSSVKLEEVTTVNKKFHNPNGAISRLQDYRNKLMPDSVYLKKSTELIEQAKVLEYSVVRSMVSGCNPFVSAFSQFFDQLHFQIAFYRGAVNLRQHLQRFGLSWCMPSVAGRDELCFRELKEAVMCIEQHREAVGNSCEIRDRMLLVVTGANQGGKSTFLRSIGIAQVMMQCGMMVAAESYRSGIFPNLFTHFTRREDSAMNSGRLDEELRRMNQIVEHLGDGSMILLNESFASTTEKEGSLIAYDIVRALLEAGVKVLTVTHLLSFAQRIYDENRGASGIKVEFLSAERLEDGRRTFKMIQHAPELTSFGLDLYEEIVEKRK